jgi:hypothetical protein
MAKGCAASLADGASMVTGAGNEPDVGSLWAGCGGGMSMLAEHQLLVGKLDSVMVEPIRKVAAIFSSQRVITVRVILGGESVVAPDGVVPVLQEGGIAVAHHRTPLGGQVPLGDERLCPKGNVMSVASGYGYLDL